MSHPEFNYTIQDLDDQLPDKLSIVTIMQRIGAFVLANGHRLSTHPGPYNVLASPKPEVVDKAILDLDAHAHIFDTLGLPADNNTKINIHVGGAYGDKVSAMQRFTTNFGRLGSTTQARLTVENDDRASMYSVQDLYDGIYSVIGIPIVFDYHHHQFCTGGLSEQQALELAMSTWPADIVPTVHYSESREVHDNSGDPTPAHSYLIHALPDTYGHHIDIMVEAKGKELAILPFMGLEDTVVVA
jgi:UV DNA damage endonuclease